MEKRLTMPILFLIFNRPDTTQRVFNEIRKAKPTKLFVAADGPRPDRRGESEKCKAARDIINQVDWDCKLCKLYRDKNLGCRIAVSSAIDWFFENVKEGIILEDDCLPSQSFFWFCQELLEKYRDDERVMMIGGTNVNGEWKSDRQSYHFSIYGGIWGWASWRRAWNHFDVEMTKWGNAYWREQIKYLIGKKQYKERARNYEKTFNKQLDSWDYAWSFARLINSGMSVVPSKNLISNVGFSSEATHTKNRRDKRNNPKKFEIDLPLINNPIVIVDKDYDYIFSSINNQSLLKRIISKARKIFQRICIKV